MQPKNYTLLRVIMLMSYITTISAEQETVFQKSSRNPVTDFFTSYPALDVIEQDIVVKNPTVLRINNLDGDITIQTEPNTETVRIAATRRTRKPEFLDDITVSIDPQHANNHHVIHVSTTNNNPKAKGTVDYAITIPTHIALDLKTEHGSITVIESDGPIKAETKKGDIRLQHTQRSIVAQVHERGGISIHNAQGEIRAKTHLGNITLHEISNSVIAACQRGRIHASCHVLPETSRMLLTSNNGIITLGLPEVVNATIYGKTDNGTLTSDHFITIKPQTTQLNKLTWNRFKQEVHGTIGSGQADIQLRCQKGNIKIINDSNHIVS